MRAAKRHTGIKAFTHRVINYKATQIVFDWTFHEFGPGWVISTIAVRCL